MLEIRAHQPFFRLSPNFLALLTLLLSADVRIAHVEPR